MGMRQEVKAAAQQGQIAAQVAAQQIEETGEAAENAFTWLAVLAAAFRDQGVDVNVVRRGDGHYRLHFEIPKDVQPTQDPLDTG